jgi:hypothetical protein
MATATRFRPNSPPAQRLNHELIELLRKSVASQR